MSLIPAASDTSSWMALAALLLFTIVLLFLGASFMIVLQRLLSRRGIVVPGINLAPKYREPLLKHFIYYQRLGHEDKTRFEKKVQYFIATKDFVARGMPEVTAQMKALISASAVQLTFGLPKVTLLHFERILVYPDNYYSTISRKYHKGEVNPAFKIIVVSWKAFVEGYINHESGINLGLHEMAHALHLENQIKNREYNFFNKEAWKRYQRIANEEMRNLSEGNDGVFRKYGITDKYEFFAVVVENFFERPELFKGQKPELYLTMCEILNQNPIELLQNMTDGLAKAS